MCFSLRDHRSFHGEKSPTKRASFMFVGEATERCLAMATFFAAVCCYWQKPTGAGFLLHRARVLERSSLRALLFATVADHSLPDLTLRFFFSTDHSQLAIIREATEDYRGCMSRIPQRRPKSRLWRLRLVVSSRMPKPDGSGGCKLVLIRWC